MNIRKRGAFALTVALVASGYVSNVAADEPPPTNPVSVEDVLNSGTAETQELAEDLTITFEDVVDQQVIEGSECVEAGFLTNSTKAVVPGDRAYRQDTDSVTIPFQSDVVEEMLGELKLEEDCRNIVVLIANIQALAESDLTIDGRTLYELNSSWMDPCLALAGSNQEYFEASALGNLVRVEVDGDNRTTYVRAEVQGQCALFLNVLLSKAQVVGLVDNLQTVENWHLLPIANQLPRATRNDLQYRGRFLVLVFSLKGYGCVEAFGFNHGAYLTDGTFNPLGDKRFARFACEDVSQAPPEETPPTEETTPPSSSTPGTNPPSSTTPAPTTTPDAPTTTEPPSNTTTTEPPSNTTTSTTTPAPTTTLPAPTTTLESKDHTRSPVSDDPNDSDEVTRPNVTAPPVVIRPTVPAGQTTTTQAPPPPTIQDPPEVQDPEPAISTTAPTPHVTNDPAQGNDADGDGIPD